MDTVGREQFFIQCHHGVLPDGGTGLQLPTIRRPTRQPQSTDSCSDRSRTDEHNFLAAGSHPKDLLDDPTYPLSVQAAIPVREHIGSDFHHDRMS
jgi:hypothetical protein